MHPTMEQLRKVLEHVEFVGKSFTEPDDDWAPVLFLFCPDGVKICQLSFGQDEKDQVPDMIRQTAREFKATAGALVMSQWYVVMRADTPLAEVGLGLLDRFGVRSHPERKERVSVELYDGVTFEIWAADIHRTTDKPPTLASWEKQEYDKTSGRLDRLLPRCLPSRKV